MRTVIGLPLAALAGIAIACSSSTEERTDLESVGEAPAALSLQPSDAGTYVYFRSNGTGWGADATTRMQKVGTWVHQKTVRFTQPYMLSSGMPAVFTLTNQRDGWGTQNASLTDPAHPAGAARPYSAPGPNLPLAEGQASLAIKVPALGTYDVRFLDDSLSFVVYPAGPKPVRTMPMVVGVAQATANAVGGDTQASALVQQLVDRVEHLFNDPGVLSHAVDFVIEDLYFFTGDELAEAYKGRQNGTIRLVLTDRPEAGATANYPGSILVDAPDGLFGVQGTRLLAHETGHWLGAADLYDVDLAGDPGAENPLTDDRYFPRPSLMNYPDASDHLDITSINQINGAFAGRAVGMSETVPPVRVRATSLATGAVVAGAEVNLYPKRCGHAPVEVTPAHSGTTDAAGLFSVPGNPYEWHRDGEWGYCLFLVEVRGGDALEYGWMPITDAGYAYFAGTDYVKELRVGRGDVNADLAINPTDALLVSQYLAGQNPATFHAAAADVDCNGAIESADANLIAQKYTGLIARFPCPAQ